MAKVEKFRRKTLKEPDQFFTTSDKILHFVQDNAKSTIISILAVALIAGSVWAFRYNAQANSLRMETRLFEMEQLKKKGGTEDLSMVIEEYKKSLSEFSGGSAKQRAQMVLADLYYQNGQFKESINTYNTLLSETKVGELNHDLAQLGLAYAQQGDKNYKEAILSFRAVIDGHSSLPLFQAYTELARCYELNNDSKNAILVYREMQVKFPAHPDLEKVESSIKELEAKA